MEEALVFCEGAFATANGKTAHGLVRDSRRFRIVGVIDSTLDGRDAGLVLEGKPNGIPIFGSIDSAHGSRPNARWLLMGLAPDGGQLPPAFEVLLLEAIESGLSIESGLHDKLRDHPKLVQAAQRKGVRLVDVREGPPEGRAHFFTGRIEEVKSYRIAVLGTDSAVGKRTTARLLDQALVAAGIQSVFIGTGQTARLQGAKYGICLDAIVNDFVTGEIEHVLLQAWDAERPDAMVLEGQGSITHPAYPGGFELIAAGRPDAIVLQHAPGRKHLDGFPQYPMPALEREMQILELLSQKPVIALTLNHENLERPDVERISAEYEKKFKIPCCDPLWDGLDRVVDAIAMRMGRRVAAKKP